MNFRLVFKQLGLLLIGLGLCMAVCDLAAWLMTLDSPGDGADRLQASWALLASAGASIVLGGGLWLVARGASAHVSRREALLLVAFSWLGGAVLCALPFFFWAMLTRVSDSHAFGSFINCYFEAMSGLTTTGATVLVDVEAMPSSMLLWRATTHWLGGLGIIVLFVAVLPMLGVGGKKLFRVEAPGPDPEGVRPHIREAARMLWMIYLGLTVAEILALRLIGGMSTFDSVCHTFATLATGGFSTHNASIGGYNSLVVDVIVMIFMILAGVNFGLYFAMMRRRFTGVLRDVELRVYFAIILIGSAIVIASLMLSGDSIVLTSGERVDADFANSLRHGLFTTLTCQTTTGFCTADFNQWPFLAKAVLITLMFIGASAGSTGGGTKVIRIWISIKVMIGELERVFRPQVVRPLKIGKSAIDAELKLSTIAYVVGIIVLFALGSVLIMVLEQLLNPLESIDYTTAATASVATLFNIGPGLGRVGAVENYLWFSDASKIVMTLLMALGRLEIFAIAILFSPRFWRGD